MDAINQFHPAAWPDLNLLALFGLVVALGTLGGLLAKVEKADIIHICDETSSRGSKI